MANTRKDKPSRLDIFGTSASKTVIFKDKAGNDKEFNLVAKNLSQEYFFKKADELTNAFTSLSENRIDSKAWAVIKDLMKEFGSIELDGECIIDDLPTNITIFNKILAEWQGLLFEANSQFFDTAKKKQEEPVPTQTS